MDLEYCLLAYCKDPTEGPGIIQDLIRDKCTEKWSEGYLKKPILTTMDCWNILAHFGTTKQIRTNTQRYLRKVKKNMGGLLLVTHYLIYFLTGEIEKETKCEPSSV